MLVLLAAACAPRLPECEEHQHITASNTCADDPTVPGSEAFPACSLLATADRIDVATGCADGACHDTTYDEMNEALGEEGECHELAGEAFCDWLDGGLGSFFADDDGDDLPDDGAIGSGIFLRSPYDGATEDGLGLGVSMACWLDAYGYTDDVEYEDDGAWIAELWWPPSGLFVDDDDGDGLVDRVSLFGR